MKERPLRMLKQAMSQRGLRAGCIQALRMTGRPEWMRYGQGRRHEKG